MKENGLIHLYMGNGKGKSTAAAGLTARMAGNGFRVLFVQFLKSMPTGEIKAFEQFDGLVSVFRPEMRHKAFLWNQTAEQKQETAADLRAGWLTAKERLQDADIRLFVFDELLDVLSMGILTESELKEALLGRHPGAEVVLTGRTAPENLLVLADYATRMDALKHPYEKGIGARRGVEF